MIASKFLGLVAFAISIYAPTANAQNTSAVNFVSLVPLSVNVAAVELFGTRDTQTRLIYQDSNGAIAQYGVVNGPFTTGQTQFSNILVPASEPILRGTPVAVTAIGNADQGFHVYFLGPDRSLKEYKWTASVGGRYGNACPECIDHTGFTVAAGSNWLYALENPSSNVLRVGFVSPGAPGTLSEAVKINDGAAWQFAPLPN